MAQVLTVKEPQLHPTATVAPSTVWCGLSKTGRDREDSENHHMHVTSVTLRLYYILFWVIILYFINRISCFLVQYRFKMLP